MTNKPDSATRQRILKAALGRFAYSGYAAVSVREIVADARVTKPTLYYYFKSKAGLYQALVDRAHDERFGLIEKAAARATSLAGQLSEILTALFKFLKGNRELMRIAFATAFAAPGEIPAEINYLKKSRRNLQFFESLIKRGLEEGILDADFQRQELAMAIYGMMNIYVIANLVGSSPTPNRRTAETIVRLYLTGAAKKTDRPGGAAA